jgi:hypothetical protein
MTTHSTLSIRGSDPGFAGCSTRPRLDGLALVQSQIAPTHHRFVGRDFFEQPVGVVQQRFPNLIPLAKH